MRKLLSLLVFFAFLLPCLPSSASAAAGFSDVPADSWATSMIDSVSEYGLMEGMGDGTFGYGASVKRAEFVTVLCRMFGWEPKKTQSSSFRDVPAEKWYYTYVETALAHDVFDHTQDFHPESAATREEMATMLVRALGYKTLAEKAEQLRIQPFTDVEENCGYIAVAYDIGMINGMGDGIFAPNSTAKREEMAAMLVRVYEKLYGKTEWLHGFYAFSSYAQRYTAQEMDAISAGWSRLCLGDNGVYLNTTASDGNEWCIPDSYESITGYLSEANTPLNLNIYMDNSSGTAGKILTNAENRAQAIAAILTELTQEYTAIGKNPYLGVTIDFEGLSGRSQKEGFIAFLNTLNTELDKLRKTLYVAVQPVAEGGYYDGYDYRAIGQTADKVILMAHDYNATDLSGFEGSSYYKTTALTPLSSVYYSLRAITDPETGVADKSKLSISISFSSLAWTISDGLLIKAEPVRPTTATIYTRLKQADSIIGWSDTYKNPYAVYKTESGEEIFLWYEDARSVSEKLQLARLFGISGVSVWRIGNIPDYTDNGLYYDAWSVLK